ncbi:hypothetical protein OG349_21310 [Streptomyces sp. NBC_01317]|uniref:hypothetical protein n=1 Tax=Streptomyces sp. NBC_01317 TaxID=2903822 RepID=UPI002E0F50DD|nr:hypothetical protein OG349_21310 [Streptomyces sp. NBC_01317]
MRSRTAAAVAAVAAVAAMALPATAGAATAEASAATASATVPATWIHTGETFPNRTFCDGRAAQLAYQGQRPQCRGPMADGRFHLWVYV